MTTQTYKGCRIERDARFRWCDVYQLHDKDSAFPTKQHLTRTKTLKDAKDWINKRTQKEVADDTL